ncbi:MAG: InlB B-repeat-containing protein [Endomicrobia bacterium]|nr:InlB B-repeat-containing protein [Endomicrobiia bacterium]
MKKNFLLLLFIFLFACPQQENKKSGKTSTQTQVYTLSFSVSPTGSGSIKVNPQTSGNRYTESTVVTLEAQPNLGWDFSYWSGDIEKTTSTIVVLIMNSNKTIIANFVQKQSTYTPTYTLQTDVYPQNAGYITRNPNLASYSYGSEVSLQAVSATGYFFVNWSGDVPTNLQNSNPINILMNSNKQITANFSLIPADKYSLSIIIDPPGGGQVNKNPNKAYYDLSEQVQLEAVPSESFIFDGWSGNLSGNTNPVTVTITGNLQITANFSQSQYKINITINPTNTGVVNKNPNYEWYYPNTVVQLQAVPLQGYKFTGWSGDVVSSSNPITIITDSNKNIIANFQEFSQQSYTLTIQFSPQSASALWVEKNPDKISYNYGEQVTLTANPPSGWTFLRWSVNNVEYNVNPVTITITGNTTVVAYFQ